MPTGSLSNLPFFKDKHVGNGLNSRIPPNMARQQGQFVQRKDWNHWTPLKAKDYSLPVIYMHTGLLSNLPLFMNKNVGHG